jgi:hypothetical protein
MSFVGRRLFQAIAGQSLRDGQGLEPRSLVCAEPLAIKNIHENHDFIEFEAARLKIY